MQDDYGIHEGPPRRPNDFYTVGYWRYRREQLPRIQQANPEFGRIQVDRAIFTAWRGCSEREREAYELRAQSGWCFQPDTEAPLFEWLTDDLILEIMRHLGARSLSYACCTSRVMSNLEREHSDELWKAALTRRQDKTVREPRLDPETRLEDPSEKLLYISALHPGGVRARLGWSYKKRFIDAYRTVLGAREVRPLLVAAEADQAGSGGEEGTLPEHLNEAFDFFVQMFSSEQPSSRNVHTVKVVAADAEGLAFFLDEDTTLEFSPHGFEVHALRRADGAMARVFHGSYADDAEYEGQWCDVTLAKTQCDCVSIGIEDPQILERRDEMIVELNAVVSFVEPEGDDFPTRYPRDYEWGEIQFTRLEWNVTDMDGNNNGTDVYPSVTEYDFEVRKLYNALHGSPGNLVRWML